MEGRGLRGGFTTDAPPLHTSKPLRRTAFNRLFAVVYFSAVLALLYRHVRNLFLYPTTSFLSFSITLSLFISDLVLAFMWATAQAYRVSPIRRREFPENLKQIIKDEDFPGIDVFICTADPYKEPPMNVVNTALSLMAYDYPADKISVYVSDDGGSALTLFAFMEAAKFASHWLPFCREHNIMERSPPVYFETNHPSSTPHFEKIKSMYEEMKVKVEYVVDKSEIIDDNISDDQRCQAFNQWSKCFTQMDHPTVIQIILDMSKDKDISGHSLPNLIYVSRQKSKTSPHHFKAGALNVLLRVSAAMTNSPVILTQDCDMYSNDPGTPLRVLCYLSDPDIKSSLAFIQFPQRFHGLNEYDTYASEYKRLFQINPLGFDGLKGPNYVGSGCFFRRRALFGGPSTLVQPEISELNPDHAVNRPIESQNILTLAHHVAGCNYENQTQWGSKIGFRYGSLVEDYYTGYRLQCEGWKSLFCDPERAAFLGDVPITLLDVLGQCKRWGIGLFEVTFSKYNTLIFGSQSMGVWSSLAYSHYAFWPIWCIPVSFYCFLPQLALANQGSIFPKVLEPWFFVYVFLVLGAYGQDFLDFVLAGGTVRRWWNAQRLWMMRGLTCFLFGSVEYMLKSIGIAAHGFSLTSKVLDNAQSKRYGQGIFEFGVPSPLFVPLTMAAIINLFSLVLGMAGFVRGNTEEGLGLQMILTGFIVLNCLPIYGAIALRNDAGKMPTRITVVSTFILKGSDQRNSPNSNHSDIEVKTMIFLCVGVSTPGSNGQALVEDRLLRVRTSNRELFSQQNGLSPDMNKGEENVKSPLDLLVEEGAGSSKDLRNQCRSTAEAGIDDMKPRYSDIALKQATTKQQMKRLIIKATYREDMISFLVSLSSSIMQLKEKVAKRRKLKVSTSDIEHLDDDNRRVLIACVSDLQECLDVSRSSGSNIVKLYVHNIMANLGSSCESSGELWLGCI
ncbi:hypothetical protein GQ457_16G025940 [Hibiscus cannabinus]